MAGPKYQCSGLPLGSTMCPTGRPMPSSALSTSPVGATGEFSCTAERSIEGSPCVGYARCESVYVAALDTIQYAVLCRRALQSVRWVQW